MEQAAAASETEAAGAVEQQAPSDGAAPMKRAPSLRASAQPFVPPQLNQL